MAEHGDSARRIARANVYLSPIYKSEKIIKPIQIYTCNNCGNVLRTKTEIEDKLCKTCKEKK